MANVTAGDHYQVSLFCRADDQIAVNVRHFQCINIAAGAPTEQGIADGFDTLFSALYIPMLANTAEWMGVRVQYLAPGPERVAVFGTTNQAFGTNGATLLPRTTCGMITLNTALAGRANRGRFYAAFPSTVSDNNAGHPTLAYQVLLQAMADKLTGTTVVGPAGNTANMRGELKRAGFLSWQFFDHNTVRAKWATQKRRGDYGRPNIF